MVHLSITSSGVELTPGGEVVLCHQSWDDYEELLQCRQDHAAVKVQYDARRQEIRLMAPLPGHANRSDTLSDLVKALLRHAGRDWQSFDPITLKRIGESGLEPDKCFYIQNLKAILGRERIDLEVDPPPDLALEVDMSCSTNVEDYVPIRIPEVWIYRKDSLHLFCFDGQRYREVVESPTFPGIPVGTIVPEFIQRAWQIGSSVALREFENVLASRG